MENETINFVEISTLPENSVTEYITTKSEIFNYANLNKNLYNNTNNMFNNSYNEIRHEYRDIANRLREFADRISIENYVTFCNEAKPIVKEIQEKINWIEEGF